MCFLLLYPLQQTPNSCLSDWRSMQRYIAPFFDNIFMLDMLENALDVPDGATHKDVSWSPGRLGHRMLTFLHFVSEDVPFFTPFLKICLELSGRPELAVISLRCVPGINYFFDSVIWLHKICGGSQNKCYLYLWVLAWKMISAKVLQCNKAMLLHMECGTVCGSMAVVRDENPLLFPALEGLLVAMGPSAATCVTY